MVLSGALGHYRVMTSITAETPTLVVPPTVPARPRRGWAAQLSRDSLYLLLGLPMGILAFTVIVTGWSTGLSSIITLVGVPITMATIFATRGVANIERHRAAIVTGEAIAGRYRVTLPLHRDDYRSGRALWERSKAILLDGQTWRDTGYGLLLLPVGIAGFTVAVTGWVTSVALLTVPAWWWIPGVKNAQDGNGWWIVDTWPKAFASCVAGVVLLALTGALVRGLATGSASLANWMLGSDVQDLERRVERLTETRAGAVDAAQSELARIERDLHDGAQARLVAAAMGLGMAEQKLDANDHAAARSLIAEARAETQRALAELRDLARGIRPALLSERGLKAAVTSLADRGGGVPATVTYRVAQPVTQQLETAAYFVVAEALANVAKHAGARAAAVRIERLGDRLEVEIRDDGNGGADAGGGGLTGLRKRVEALDGALFVSSPAGGPTILRAEFPCAS